MEHIKLKKIFELNNFPSKNKLYKLQRDEGLGFTQKQVNDFIEKQETYQLTAKQKKQKIFSSVIAPPKGNLMIDLMIYDRFKYGRYQYILTVIDIYSRKAWAVALTSKDKKSTINALKSIFHKANHVWTELQMDNGGEFTSKEFKEAMNKLGVKTLWYSEVGDIRKQSVIERFNRTLAEMLQKWREGTKRRDWVTVLDKIVDIYNSTEHSTIKAVPNDVWDGKDINKQVIIKVQPHFKVGDNVRVKVQSKTFNKGDQLQFSRQIYKIKAIKGQKYIIVNEEDNTELKQRYSSDMLRLANDVQYAEVENRESKGKELDNQVIQNKKEKKIKIETNKLKNDDSSIFDKAVSTLDDNRRTIRKPKRYS